MCEFHDMFGLNVKPRILSANELRSVVLPSLSLLSCWWGSVDRENTMNSLLVGQDLNPDFGPTMKGCSGCFVVS